MGVQLYTRWVSPLYILSIFGVQWQKGVCQMRVFLMMANDTLKPKLYHMYTKLAWYSDAVQMLFNNIGVFTVFYNSVRFRYHHSFNLYVFTCSLNENTALTLAVCTARVRFMMEQLRRSVKAAVIFYSYSIKCIIDSDIWLSHKLLPMCSTKPLTEMLTCQRLCLYCVCCYSKSL